MTQNSIPDDEAQVAGLLRVLDDDAARVDHDALDRMRDLLMREFELAAPQPEAASLQTVGFNASATLPQITPEMLAPNSSQAEASSAAVVLVDTSAATAPEADHTNATVTLSRLTNDPPPRSSYWSTIVLAVVLGAAAVSLWFIKQSASFVSPMALASVLDDVASADSLRLEVRMNGTLQEIVVKQPGKARWQTDQKHYRLFDGTRLWHVDEEQNEARIEPAMLALRMPTSKSANAAPRIAGMKEDSAQRLSLLSVLGVQVGDRRDLIRALPVKQEDVEGVPCSFYEAVCDANVGGDVAGKVRIEAVVETESRRVRTLTVWPAERDERRVPLADVRLLALNPKVDEDQFVIAPSLSQDGRIGRIQDTQGIVTLRPTLHDRWTPVCQQALVKAQDSIRTDLRGPHVVRVMLTSNVRLTLGPGSEVEFVSPYEARLIRGQVAITFPSSWDREFVLRGPKGVERWEPILKDDPRALEKIERESALEIDKDGKLIYLQEYPKWLPSFEGADLGNPLGSLICNVDGRNEPLSVGYHQVNVEIRDQIARTTIEESFVNHTGARLEGTFHFPLPGDASISGFGMWIGNQLVEADIVEKQRARDIYETILRERRDPGLLEWTQGNLFKARVFPIEPHSEKRVKIVYTQVLSLRGNQYRYSYALQSDLLKLHPVRELSVNVLINSTLPLGRIECPTHDVQTQQTQHSAQVKFGAREFIPQRDFELVCSLDAKQNDVVVIPHQRGNDGYLLVQITPPTSDGQWQREVVPNGTPAELLLLCDTSGSMDAGKRQQQADFIAALLSSLSEKDRFNLAGCDVNSVWAFPNEKSVPATAANVELARKFLTDRKSLGWTDLDRALAAARDKANDASQVIYVGDGIVTAGDGDAHAFAGRVTAASKAPNASKGRPTFHAVSVGNTIESTVLKSLAHGGGSMRGISGEMTASKVALELLNEITQPGLRDVQIEFRGVPIAAVYPSKLPNLAAGTQQMVLARYLPEATANNGASRGGKKVKTPLEVIVTGKRGTESVRFVAKTNFADAEEGNSFIPRLWARLHLDQLLSQGKSQTLQDQIIRLSEEFHIITPYTSLLVLETDADRERFGVKRRYEMRDGEQYFAAGRDNAKYELQQQYMAAQRAWREGLRRSVLKKLATLGRDPNLHQRLQQQNYWGGQSSMLGDVSGVFMERLQLQDSRELFSDGLQRSTRRSGVFGPYGGMGGMGMGGGFGGGGGGGFGGDYLSEELSLGIDEFDAKFDTDGGLPSGSIDLSKSSKSLRDFSEINAPDDNLKALEELSDADVDSPDLAMENETASLAGSLAAEPAAFDFSGNFAGDFDGTYFRMERGARGLGAPAYWEPGAYQRAQTRAFDVLRSIIPQLTPAAQQGESIPDAANWNAEAVAVSKGLLRADSLLKLPAGRGIEVRSTTRSTDKRWQRVTENSELFSLLSGSRWLTRPQTAGSQDVVNWCDTKQRGVFSNAFGLGQVRKSESFELRQLPLDLLDFSMSPLHGYFAHLKAKVVRVNDTETRVELWSPARKTGQVTINTVDRIVTKIEYFEREGSAEPNHTLVFSDFVDVAGRKWARRCVRAMKSDSGETETVFNYTITEHAADAFANCFKSEFAGHDQTQFVHLPLPSVKKAKNSLATRKASFEDHLVLLAHVAKNQQWARMFEQLEAIDALPVAGVAPVGLGTGKDALSSSTVRGRWWLRTVLSKLAGKNEVARQRLMSVAQVLVAEPTGRHDMTLAQTTHNELYGISDWNEYSRLIRSLKPVFDRQPQEVDAASAWQAQWINCLRSLGRSDEVRAEMAKRVAAQPWDYGQQVQLANDIAATGDFEAARQYIEQQRQNPKWNESERAYFRDSLGNLYRNHQRRTLLVEMLEQDLNGPNPPSDEHFFVMYLSELFLANQEAKAHQLMRHWMSDGLQILKAPEAGKAAPSNDPVIRRTYAKLHAAIQLAGGNGHSYYRGRIDERFMPELVTLVRHFARQPDYYALANHVLSQHPFGESDELIKLRGEWFGFLKAELKTLKSGHLSSLVGWVLPNEPETTRDEWLSISAAIRERWLGEKDETEKHSLGQLLEQIYSQRLSDTHLLPFLREQLAAASAQYRETDRRRLFDALMRAKWSLEIEREAAALIPQLGEQPAPVTSITDAAEVIDRKGPVDSRKAATTHDISFQVISLHQFVDRMLQARQEAVIEVLRATTTTKPKGSKDEAPDGGKSFDSLPRGEHAQKRAELLKAAREGVATTLVEATAALRKGAQAKGTLEQSLADWLALERGYLDLQLGRQRDHVLAECWGWLGESPLSTPDAAKKTGAHAVANDPTRSWLKQRALTVVMNLTCRRGATDGEIDRLFKYIEVGIAGPTADPTAKTGDEDDFDREAMTYRWKKLKYDVLIALDRPEALERELLKWIKADSIVSPWRVSLARLKAERGDIKTAIELFEAVQRDDELKPVDQATLAKWYLASDRRADYERARVAQWQLKPEHQISQTLYQLLQPYQRTDHPPPSTLDDNVLFAFRALFAKSNSPSSYLAQLKQWYDQTRDFRLLDMIPDAVIGKTPQQIYEVLQQLQHTVLVELRDEATSDELLRRIRHWRDELEAVQKSKQPAATALLLGTSKSGEIRSVDLRALDLLETLVERKASEVLNQPGPHVAAALAAMKRAFDRHWAEGEQRQMADFLAGLGAITQLPLAEEQVRELEELARRQQPGTSEHLFVTAAWTRFLMQTGSQERAIGLLGHAVREFERTHADGWPADANAPITEYINHLNGASKSSIAEELIQRQLQQPNTSGQREFFRHRLLDVYQHAYATDQRVTLGEGEALLKALRMHVLERATQAHEGQRAHYLHSMSQLCSSAKDKHPEVARETIRAFAFEQLPTLLMTQLHDYGGVISSVGETLKNIDGSRAALEFYIERLEQYPSSINYWDTAWHRHGQRIAELRHEVGSLGKFEARLLKLVLQELRLDLQQRDHRPSHLYRPHNHHFWSDKKADFLKVAEEVLASRRESGQTALFVADYLYGLGEYDRAIEILFQFHQRVGLRQHGLNSLVSYLQGRNRHAEAIPVLEPLVKRAPDHLWYRTQLMIAYNATNRREMLQQLQAATNVHFRHGSRWNEGVAAALGDVCVQTGLHEIALDNLREAIAMRIRDGHVHGDDVLWTYYRNLSSALLHLKRTQESIEAAAAAIVMWPQQHHRRQEAIDHLTSALKQAADRDQYAKWLDEVAAKTKQERPIVRKALGRAYRELSQFDKAIVQLKIAAEITPHDREVQQWLLNSFDDLGQKEAALAQVYVLREIDPRNLEWHNQLASRLATDEAEAERAATSIVEALPTEAESHEALAHLREGQERWLEAIDQWKKVAELRALEPTGLLGLAQAQLQAKQYSECQDTLDRLTKTKWHERFNQVRHQTEVLRAQLRAGRK